MSSSTDSSNADAPDRVPRGPVIFVAVLAALLGFAAGYVVANRIWVQRAAKMQEAYQTSLEQLDRKIALTVMAAQATQRPLPQDSPPATQP